MGSKSPALLGLGLIHKMGLITHYLLYKMIGKMNELEKKKIFFWGEVTVNKLISDYYFICYTF